MDDRSKKAKGQNQKKLKNQVDNLRKNEIGEELGSKEAGSVLISINSNEHICVEKEEIEEKSQNFPMEINKPEERPLPKDDFLEVPVKSASVGGLIPAEIMEPSSVKGLIHNNEKIKFKSTKREVEDLLSVIERKDEGKPLTMKDDAKVNESELIAPSKEYCGFSSNLQNSSNQQINDNEEKMSANDEILLEASGDGEKLAHLPNQLAENLRQIPNINLEAPSESISMVSTNCLLFNFIFMQFAFIY